MHGAARLTPEIVLAAYAEGLFPMAEARDDPTLYWISPDARGVIPLDALHIPRRLARTIRSDRFTVTTDTAFSRVIAACAEPAEGREDTWIKPESEALYTAWHQRGHAHSSECWLADDLVGGLYGVNLGGAFFGESMFSRTRDASKVALAHLVARLRHGGFMSGCERSGHLWLDNFCPTGHGLIAGRQGLSGLADAGRPAGEAAHLFEPLPQILENVRFRAGAVPLEDDKVKSQMEAATQRLNGKGRILVRKSGTEPLIRVMAEGEDETIVREVVRDLADAIREAAA